MELRRYWNVFWQRRKLFYWIFAVTILTALLFSLIYQYVLVGAVYKVPVYLLVMKQDYLPEFVSGSPNDLGKLNSDNFATNALTIAESDPIMLRVAERLQLKTHSGKLYTPSDFVNGGIIKIIGMGRGVIISNTENTEVIEIDGVSTNFKEAADIANTFADEISKEVVISNKNKAQTAIKFFESEMPKMLAKLTAAENNALAYRQKEHVTDLSTYRVDELAMQVTYEQTIDSADKQLKVDIKRKKALLDQLAKQPEFKLSTITYAENPQIENIKANLLTYERQVDSDLLLYTKEHPTVKTDQQQVESSRRQLKEQIDKIFSQESKARNSYYDTLLQELGDTETDIIAQQAIIEISKEQLDIVVVRLDDLSRKETEYNRLSRIVSSLNSIYTGYIASLEAAKALLNVNTDNLAFFSPAPVPTDNTIVKSYIYFPKKKIVLILAIALGIFFGIGAIFIVDYVDDRIYHVGHLRAVGNVPVVGVVNQSSSVSGNIQSSGFLSSSARQQAQEIVTHWKLKAGKNQSILSLFSALPGEGKTFLTAALGTVRAESGERVLLIDANVISPALGSLFNIPVKENPVPLTLEQARNQIVGTAVPNLSILRVGSSSNWDMEKFSAVLRDLQKEYPVILIDTPALTVSRFGALLSISADQSYLITRFGMTRPVHVQQANAILQETGISPTGMILNGVK